jgi:hypothetical protein
VNQISIEKRVIDTKEHTAICVGEVSGELPRHLMSGTQEPGYTYKDGELSSVYYSGITDSNKKRYIMYENIDLLLFSEIAHSLRGEAKKRILELSSALQKVGQDFIQSASGIIPTWRIFWIVGGGVLLLPDRLSSLILYSASDEDRAQHLYRYMKPNILPPFGLTHQLTQILYYSATTRAPYESSESKEMNWTHIPLSLGFTPLNKKMRGAIDATLQMSLSQQRTSFSGAYSSSDNLSYFDNLFTELDWEVTESDPSFEQYLTSSPPLSSYMEKFTKKAQNKLFMRKKGAPIILSSIAVLVVLFAIVQCGIQANKPPYTSSMSQQEIIQEFFMAQNELDIEKMNASLQRGTKNPFEKEVSALFVNTKVRQAYEGIDAVISPIEFKEQETKSIPSSISIYGVDNITYTRINENTIDVTYEFYAPPNIEEGLEGYPLQVIKRVVQFTFNDDKGYEQIENIRLISQDIVYEEVIPIYSK